ncbi:MAG: aconitase/3-isopropylmalate dehydratase large subunit family protein [Bacteroidales bacterium]|nr:aconitase/3-isopropylmalate dehydratase large subunit family protein [Bacteroidales bacterium]
MAMTIIEKILAAHSGQSAVAPGQIVDIKIDTRAARDFGGANVVKNIVDNNLGIDDPDKTVFTFDCNPTGSDQKYAVNQHVCRLFARERGIRVFDIDAGIGTHIMIDKGLVYPGSTAVSTDSHANILGAVGAFGQGMGDMDIAAAWHSGKIWFKVPPSVRIILKGKAAPGVTSKDIVLNLLAHFGANQLLGFAIEMYGQAVDSLDLDDKITIASMATEMGAIIILFPPDRNIIHFCSGRTSASFDPVYADEGARYEHTHEFDVSGFPVMVSLPGEPHNAVQLSSVSGTKIDSAFIGSCTNGRMSDLRLAASLLSGRKVAPGVVLKIVPATDEIWDKCLEEGLIDIFRKAGALVSNPGCAGCAAGQVGQNGPGEITVSTGNRNFPGKQGRGSVYLASPATVAASAVAGFLTSSESIPEEPALFTSALRPGSPRTGDARTTVRGQKELVIQGRVWKISRDNIDTDMIYHNRHLAVTEISEMGRYAFGNLKGYEDFAAKAKPGDIVVTGKNFGSGSSRQQAVDCFLSLGIQAIVAESFGAIYERNAINAAFPVVACTIPDNASLSDGDILTINLVTGTIVNQANNEVYTGNPFSEVQISIFMRGGLLG